MFKKVLGVVAVLALVLPVAAQETPVVDHAHDTVVNVLQLTPEQVTAWDALLTTRKEAVTPLREDLGDVLGQLKALLDEPDPDAEDVGNLTIQAKDLRDQIHAANVAYLEGFQSLLDEEQATKLAFLRRADKVRKVLPAFKVFGLIARD